MKRLPKLVVLRDSVELNNDKAAKAKIITERMV